MIWYDMISYNIILIFTSNTLLGSRQMNFRYALCSRSSQVILMFVGYPFKLLLAALRRPLSSQHH